MERLLDVLLDSLYPHSTRVSWWSISPYSKEEAVQILLTSVLFHLAFVAVEPELVLCLCVVSVNSVQLGLCMYVSVFVCLNRSGTVLRLTYTNHSMIISMSCLQSHSKCTALSISYSSLVITVWRWCSIFSLFAHTPLTYVNLISAVLIFDGRFYSTTIHVCCSVSCREKLTHMQLRTILVSRSVTDLWQINLQLILHEKCSQWMMLDTTCH